jgi:hypothetical protein
MPDDTDDAEVVAASGIDGAERAADDDVTGADDPGDPGATGPDPVVFSTETGEEDDR